MTTVMVTDYDGEDRDSDSHDAGDGDHDSGQRVRP